MLNLTLEISIISIIIIIVQCFIFDMLNTVECLVYNKTRYYYCALLIKLIKFLLIN